jgi:hypothetical protein
VDISRAWKFFLALRRWARAVKRQTDELSLAAKNFFQEFFEGSQANPVLL